MEQKIEKILTAVTELQESQTGMRESISELQQITRALRDGQEETEAKVDALGSNIEAIAIDLNAVKKKMATKEDLLFFDRKIGEHDRELDKLNRRSS
ncbi:hypothetical protein [Salicibibacter halophilus]|nr:hypothetical protein [Salicibibacter halophilus]